MSRSYKHISIRGVTKSESEKDDKRKANRVFRRMSKVAITHQKLLPEHLREVSNVWKFSKDGKRYVRNEKLRK